MFQGICNSYAKFLAVAPKHNVVFCPSVPEGGQSFTVVAIESPALSFSFSASDMPATFHSDFPRAVEVDSLTTV